MTKFRKILAAMVITAGAAGVAAGAMAGGHMKGEKKATGPVAERKAAMKAAKQNFKPLVGMVKGEVPFDAATVKKNAMAIAEALKKAKANFPTGSDKGETRAKPEIWQMKAEFDALFDKSIELAMAIEKAGDKAALGKAVMALGGEGCKACHKKFRMPKK
jgi:cytochrome c556